MAHVEKIAQSNITALSIHLERREGCELSNKEIDKSRTYLNYNLASDLQPLSPENFIKKRVNEVKHMKRKDIIKMVDWIVTLPANVPTEDEAMFFHTTYEFLKDKYKEKNVICAYVHNDETTPHIHFSFVPVVFENGIEKLNCKKLITKVELKQFHPALGDYLEKEMGYRPEIQNNATINGNRSVKELKANEDLSLQKTKDNIRKTIAVNNELVKEADSLEFEKTSVISKAKTLVKANEIIDQLKNNNKTLVIENKSLIHIIDTQKVEIDGYRSMPLAKKLNNSKRELKELKKDNYELSNDKDYYQAQTRKLNNHNEQLLADNNSLRKRVSLYERFIHFFKLEEALDIYKNLADKEGRLPIKDSQALVSQVINKVKEILEDINNRLSGQTIKEREGIERHHNPFDGPSL